MTSVVGDSFGAGIADVTAIIRRAVASRVENGDVVDEIVQETLARLLAASRRLDDAAAGPYAIVTARNLVASRWRSKDMVNGTSGMLTERERRVVRWLLRCDEPGPWHCSGGQRQDGRVPFQRRVPQGGRCFAGSSLR